MLQSTATYILLPWPHRRVKYELHRYLLGQTALDEVWLIQIEAAVFSLLHCATANNGKYSILHTSILGRTLHN